MKIYIDKLCHPEEETWPVRLPIAFGCIADVLRSTGIATGASGNSKWNPDKEDQERGLIEATLNFQESLGAGRTAQVYARTIKIVAELTPEDGNSTKVKFEFEVFSPMGAGTVRGLIKRTLELFRGAVDKNKENPE